MKITTEPTQPPPSEPLIRVWAMMGTWGVPVMMGIAYVALALTSETDHTGQAWMAVGFAFVMYVWIVFRGLTSRAALARAVAVGDAVRLRELSDAQLARRKRPKGRAPYLVARALGAQLRGDDAAALTALDGAQPTGEWATLASYIRVLSLVGLGRTGDARTALASLSSPRSPSISYVAEGKVLVAEGDLDGAAPLFQRAIDDVRGFPSTRATAHESAASLCDARGDSAGAAKHRAAAAKLGHRPEQ